ncbi:Leucine-rich repeat-containing protein 15 [Trichoplax sp. H2]|nr:Leucine-rich repeat-containing protein 15 [Trichoplax sp. H2]|eukprot:RDD38168.1 Leucine-rich repeat-containing protein 15 [Trichoplax sp. H2]
MNLGTYTKIKLSLQGNLLRGLNSPGIFEGIRRLRHLYLGNNKIEKIVDGAFADLYWLMTLDLKDNLLKALNSQKILQGLYNLKYLYLDRNQIERITDKVFANSRFLYKL